MIEDMRHCGYKGETQQIMISRKTVYKWEGIEFALSYLELYHA